MRLLVIGHTYIAAANRGVLRRTAARGHSVTMVTPQKWPDPLFDIKAQPEQGQCGAISLPALAPGRESWYVLRKMSDALRDADPDLVRVDHGPGTMICWQAARLRKRLWPKARLLFFTWWNVPWSLRPPQSTAERAVLADADAAICGNRAAMELLKGRGFTKPMSVIPQLGVNPDIFKPGDPKQARARLSVPPEVPIIGFVGRLVQEKGVFDLLQAFSRIPEPAQLLMLGRGEARDELHAQAGRLGLSARVHFVPSVPHSEVPGLLPAFDVLVLPSKPGKGWQEQFGHVLTEAMSSGVPVIGADSGEIPHVMGDAGLLVPHSNPDNLADALGRVLDDDQLRRQMIDRGLDRVRKHYSDRAVADACLDFYGSILEGREVLS